MEAFVQIPVNSSFFQQNVKLNLRQKSLGAPRARVARSVSGAVGAVAAVNSEERI